MIPDVHADGLMTAAHRRLARDARLTRALHEARRSQGTDDPGDCVNRCAFNAHGRHE
jgi:hypothetical protein